MSATALGRRPPDDDRRGSGAPRFSAHIARGAWHEARSRRLLLIGVLVSAAFVGLFTLASVLTDREMDATNMIETATVQTVLTVLGMYAVQFLASFLAILLGAATVAGELDSGRALSVLARPLPRWSWLLQRTWTFGAMAAGYVVIMSGGVLLAAFAAGGYEALSVGTGIGLLVLQVAVLLSTAAALSTRLSVTAAASITAALYGLAWLGGIAELVGVVSDNDAVARIGVVTTLVMPSDALWHGASYYLASPLFLSTATSTIDSPPFIATSPPNTLRMVWSVVHLLLTSMIAVRWLARRDL